MSKIYVSLENNPYVNIACEYQLFLNHTSGVDLYLWQNDPCVVIGKNQNMHAEINLEYLKTNDIYPTRRFSGGGAVYQDMGNVNFTLIADHHEVSEKDMLHLVQAAVAHCGIVSEFSGRNDLMVESKKFSGLAYFYHKNKIMFHGTMLVDVNLEHLTHVLNPSKLKLMSKGIESVRNRVINLREVKPDLTTEAIKEAFIYVISNQYNSHPAIEYLTKEHVDPSLIRKLEDKQWIFGAAPNYELELQKKLPIGNVSVNVNVKKGNIESIKIYSDSLIVVDFAPLEAKLINSPFDEEELFYAIHQQFSKR